MPTFHYTAVNAAQRVTGQIEGLDEAAVRNELQGAGWTVVALKPVVTTGSGLTAVEMVAISQQFANATEAGLPLGGALRAFVEATGSARMRRRLLPAYEAIERGQPIDQVLMNPALRLPPIIAVILKSGLPPNAIRAMLAHVIESAATINGIRSRVLLLVSYPIAIFLTLCGLWAFLLLFILPIYGEIYDHSGVDIPASHRLLSSMSAYLMQIQAWLVVAVIAGVVCLGGVVYRLTPRLLRYRLWSAIPLVGSISQLVALSELAQLMAVTLECQIPLPRALAMVAEGTRDADLAESCRDAAARLEAGESVDSVIESNINLPVYAEQILRWADRGSAGCEPLRELAAMLRRRTRLLADSTMPLLEPIMMIASMAAVILYVTVVFPPMVRLLNMFS
jgi:type IV pilus assembly protein PilC